MHVATAENTGGNMPLGSATCGAGWVGIVTGRGPSVAAEKTLSAGNDARYHHTVAKPEFILVTIAVGSDIHHLTRKFVSRGLLRA